MQKIEEWFADPSVCILMHLTGNRVEDGVMLFGGSAGPFIDFSNVLHEMAHFVEIDDARCTENSWGLKMPEEYIPGRYARMCPVPKTFQAAARESRAFGIQIVLAEHFSIEISVDDSADTVHRFVPGAELIYLAFPDDLDLSYEKCKDIKTLHSAQAAKIASIIRSTAEAWPIEKIWSEWNRKIELLRAAGFGNGTVN